MPEPDLRGPELHQHDAFELAVSQLTASRERLFEEGRGRPEASLRGREVSEVLEGTGETVRLPQRLEEIASGLDVPARLRQLRLPLNALGLSEAQMRLRFPAPVAGFPILLESCLRLFLRERLIVETRVQLAEVDEGPSVSRVQSQRRVVSLDGFLIPTLPFEKVSQFDLRRRVVRPHPGEPPVLLLGRGEILSSFRDDSLNHCRLRKRRIADC